MEESAQWGLALLVGIPIAVGLAWFNKSGSDFKDGFEQKPKGKRNKKLNDKNGVQCPKINRLSTELLL